MEEIKYLRKIKCESCNSELLSIYYRGKGKFKSLPNYHYCEKCKLVFMIDTKEKGK